MDSYECQIMDFDSDGRDDNNMEIEIGIDNIFN